MSCLGLTQGNRHMHEIPVICGKYKDWFTLFCLEDENKYIKVWYYRTFHMSIINADLIKEEISGKYNVVVKEETELKKIKGAQTRGKIIYRLDDLEFTLWL